MLLPLLRWSAERGRNEGLAMLVLLLPGCHARTHALPATLSPGNRSTSIGPSGDQRARQATIATILAKRAMKPRRTSVAELTERQSFYATTELQYIPHEHPGKRRAGRPEDLSMSRRSEEGARDWRGDAIKAREDAAKERQQTWKESAEEREGCVSGGAEEREKCRVRQSRARVRIPGLPAIPDSSSDVAPASMMYPNGRDYSSGSRCGVSWDDAAVKCGTECVTECPAVQAMCFLDLPVCDHKNPAGRCWAYSGGVSDSWCVTASAMLDGSDRSKDKSDSFYNLCICEEIVVGPEAVTDEYEKPVNASELPPRDAELVAMVIAEGDMHPGLPECTWKPPTGCTNVTQYECVDGPASSQCSGENWFNQPEQCGASCVHTALLHPPPYYAVWRSGPRARPWLSDSVLPHYAAKDVHVLDKQTQWAFDHPKRILMSVWCKSSQIEFVGVSMFSPAYEEKARRLLGSCNLKGVCCKATMMASDFLGASTPEGTDAFRYRMIALKPLFLLDQMEKTLEPVVFLDVDLEFHQFPELFLDNSWPEGPRDVALFNFWANETNLTNRHTPNIGSAVAYFNKTFRAKKLLNAWAEAMQYGTNQHAPDDQVLDKLLNEGGWLERVSLGWLPSSYLRLMPSYYRGVHAVIDHDHGSAPGIDGHSRVKPKLPPTYWTEPVNEEAYMDAAAAAVAAANAADPNSVGADDPNAPPVPVQAPAPVVPVPEMAPLGQAPAPVAVPAPAPVVPATGPTVARSATNPNGCLTAAQGDCGPLQAAPLPAGGVCTGESKCCSAGGYCGSGPLYCGEGMQAEYSHSHKLCGGAAAGQKDEETVASRAAAGQKPAAPVARTSASAPAPQVAAAPAPEIPKFDPLPATPVQDPYDPALSSTDGLYRPPVPGAAPAPVGQGTGRSAEFNPAANDGLYHPSEYLLLV